jgi:hypothetical protein
MRIEKELDIVLNHLTKQAKEGKKYKDAFEQMCRYYMSLMEGDTHRIEAAHKLMREFRLVDEEGFWIGVDDE